MEGNSTVGLNVFSEKDVKNAESCTPITDITMFATPIFRERIGRFSMLKAHTPFAIDSQKDLNAHKHLTNRNLPPRDSMRAPPNQVLFLRRVPREIRTT